jgi:hypothetical protein
MIRNLEASSVEELRWCVDDCIRPERVCDGFERLKYLVANSKTLNRMMVRIEGILHDRPDSDEAKLVQRSLASLATSCDQYKVKFLVTRLDEDWDDAGTSW